VPTYEYQCDECHQTFEVWQRMTDAALETCTGCGGPVRRLLSPAAFILKGEGWYVTDYPSEARKKAMESEKGDKKAGASGEQSSTAPAAGTPTTSAPTTSAPTGGASGPASPD
jgi:putative FmdB family regulatory protein